MAESIQSHIPGSNIPNELSQLMDELSKKRDQKTWLIRNIAVSKAIINLLDLHRVICLGEWRGKEHHHPAALVYDPLRFYFYCLVGYDDEEVGSRPGHLFHSIVPHVAIAKEVFDKSNGNSTI